MEKYELGLHKKSFSLFYKGGEIWCEHLDSLYNEKELLKNKFNQDLLQIGRPSISSFLVINLDETVIDEEIMEFIINNLVMLKKSLCKVVFVGLNSKMKNFVKKRNINTSFVMTCIDDYEKAKEWLVAAQ